MVTKGDLVRVNFTSAVFDSYKLHGRLGVVLRVLGKTCGSIVCDVLIDGRVHVLSLGYLVDPLLEEAL